MALHVIVEKLPPPAADGVAVASLHIAEVALAVGVITLIAVCVQIWLARRTLEVTNVELDLARETLEAAREELRLAGQQLVETQKASEQTQRALEYSQEQITIARREAIDRLRQSAPQVTADVRFDEARQAWALWLTNRGGVARYVGLSGRDGNSVVYSRAGNTFQVLGPGEELETKMRWPAIGKPRYASNIRIRYTDTFGNRYMTEYESLGESLAYPVLREPWLGKEYGFPKPTKCSDAVSWAVEHFERLVDPGGEPLDYDEPLDS